MLTEIRESPVGTEQFHAVKGLIDACCDKGEPGRRETPSPAGALIRLYGKAVMSAGIVKVS